MVQIKTPQFPESVYEASVGAWFKAEGDAVSAGDPILELHTDKAVQEVNALEDGVITAILKQVDDVVQPGDTLCEIEPAGATPTMDTPPQAETGQAPASGTTEATAETPAPTPRAAQPVTSAPSGPPDVIEIDVAQPIPIGGAPPAASRTGVGSDIVETTDETSSAIEAADTPDPTVAEIPSQTTAPTAEAASPATQQAEDTARTTSPDSQSTANTSEPATNPSPAPAPTAPDDPRVKRVRLTRRQLTAARTMLEVTQQTVMTTTFNEVDMLQIIELRKRRGPGFLQSHGVKLGFMSFFVKAVCSSLKAFPILNSQIDGTDLLLREHYDVGIAVASERGLVVPVIRDADELTFAEIEQTIAGFGDKARSGAWSLDDLTGGTFTITNGGVFGSMLSTPILNPPQVGILGMHNIVERPVAVDGKIAVRPIMYLALTYDHRIVEGAQAVQFLRHTKEHLESAEALLIGT